jgi:excisionase family DNA binding protein
MPDNELPNREKVRLMNIRDAARYLGTTPATLYTKIWRREIPFVKFGRSVRFDVKDLDALVEESKVKPDALNNCRRLR